MEAFSVFSLPFLVLVHIDHESAFAGSFRDPEVLKILSRVLVVCKLLQQNPLKVIPNPPSAFSVQSVIMYLP